MDFERKKCFDYGCDGLISKPLHPSDLITKIERYLMK